MRENTAVEHCKTKTEKETACCNSLLFPQSIRIPILFMTLTFTLLFSTLINQSALAQCDGLCMDDQNTPKIKIAAEGIDVDYLDSVNAYFEPEKVTENNQDLLTSDIQGLSNEQDSGNILYTANDANTDSSFQASNSKEWEFILVPYAWLVGINGDLTVRGRTFHVDEGFSDLIKDLDIAAMLHGEVWWKRKFGFFVDSVFAKLSADGSITLPNSISVDIDNITKLFLLEFGGLYRAGTWDIGSPYNSFVQRSKPSVTLDLLAGGRYWYIKNELDIHGPLGILPPEVDDSKSWFDFIVGGRVRLDFYKKLTLEVRTDVGGFGLGFSSDISWNIISFIAYELPWYRITPLFGYRALYDDYSDGSGNNRFENNTWMHGPVIGVAFRF